MNWLFVATVVVLVLASWSSAMVQALFTMSRSGLTERTRGTPSAARADWLIENIAQVRLSAALLRTVLRLTVALLVVVEFVGYGESADVTWGPLLAAGATSAGALWLCTSVIAAAVARHVPQELISISLPVLRGTAWICYPLTRALAFIDEAVRRLSGASLREYRDEAEADLLRTIEDSHRVGGLDERAAELLENIVDFTSTDVGEVMTPRTDIDGLEVTDDLAEIRAFIIKVGHSRIPIYEENLDHIIGVLYVKDLIPRLGQEADDFKLRPILRQPIVVPETKQVRELLADFQKAEIHLGIVIDEYGGPAGLVTIEDVLEEIVGEIQDEHDPDDEEPPSITPIEDGRVAVDGRFHIDDLNEELHLDLPEDEEFDTVAGFVLSELGRVPKVGEIIEAHDARFTTLEATPTHILRIEVELLNGRRSGEDDGG